MSIVTMYNKHTQLLKLKMDGIVVNEIIEARNRPFLPIILQRSLSVDNLNLWISKRVLNEKRDNYEAVKKEFPHFDNYGAMFSLSDQYWFKKEGSDVTWESGNFFTNSYTDEVGKMFFSPWEVDPTSSGLPSPDLATNGVLIKAWRREGGVNYLYKTGSKKNHQQPISEVLASIMLKKLDFIPFVEYELDIYGLKLCSKCANFVDADSEFVPASHIFYLEPLPEGRTIYEHFLLMCSYFKIDGAKDYLDKMIAADKLIGNDDRHFGNFGFIRNVQTCQITGFAPLFDSGSSFYGLNEERKTAKLFEAESFMAIKEVMKKHDLNAALNHSQMFDLIEKYPEISWSKKQEMKNRILQTSRELKEMTLKINKELQKEKSLRFLAELEELDSTVVVNNN